MSNPSLPCSTEGLIPHSGLMRVVDQLTAMHEGQAETQTVMEGGPFVREDGTLEESIFIEMIAQTIAAGSGYDLTDEERRTQKGYLLGVRDFRVFGCAKQGDTLTAKAKKTAQFSGFGIVEGSVWRGQEQLAAGELKVVQILGDALPGISG